MAITPRKMTNASSAGKHIKELQDAVAALQTLSSAMSAGELAVLDGVVAGTAAVGKAVVLTTGKVIDTIDITAPKIGGTAVDATAAELNTVADVTPGTVTASKAVVVDAGKKIAGLAGITSSAAGVVAGFMPTAVQQDLTGAGAVSLTTFYTAITNNGANALTLADSTVVGQLKKVKMVVDPGTDSTLTFNTNATVVFADVGDYVLLMWNGSDWLPIELGNDADGTSAPAYTPAS